MDGSEGLPELGIQGWLSGLCLGRGIRGSVVVILVFDLVSPTRYLVLTYLADWEFEAAELSRVSQRSCKAHWSGPVLLQTAR